VVSSPTEEGEGKKEGKDLHYGWKKGGRGLNNNNLLLLNEKGGGSLKNVILEEGRGEGLKVLQVLLFQRRKRGRKEKRGGEGGSSFYLFYQKEGIFRRKKVGLERKKEASMFSCFFS